MKKLLLVLGVLLIGTLSANAATTHYNFNLSPYCDTFNIFLYSPGAGVAKAFIGGVHHTPACGFADVNVGGFKHGLAASVQGGYTGAVLDFSDTEYATWLGTPDNIEWIVNWPNNYWQVYKGDGTGNYLINSGFITRTSSPSTGTTPAILR